MRIHYLSYALIPSRTANSIHIMKMCAALASCGHDVTLFARRGEGDPDPFSYYGVSHRFSLVRFPWVQTRIIRGLYHSWQVRRAVSAQPLPDLFYGRYPHAIAAVARTGVEFIYEAHEPPPNFHEKAVVSWLIERRNLRALVVISEALREEFLRLFPALDPARIIVAHDAADEMRGGDTIDYPWPGRDSALQVGYVGHLYPGKGMDIIADLAGLVPEADFHVIGGTEADIAYWQGASRAPNLHFHGFVAPNRIGSVFARLQVVLAPYQRKVLGVGGGSDISRWMSPLKLFEYMSAAKAIVCSDLPVLREVMEDRRNCLLVSPDNVGEWATAVRMLGADPALRARLGEQARREYETTYRWEDRAKRVLEDTSRVTSGAAR